MKRSIIPFSTIFLSALLLFSCSSSQQVACPDFSKNVKVNQRTSQAYKPTKYKAPKVKQSHKLNRTKTKTTKAIITTPQMTVSTIDVEPNGFKAPVMANVISSVEVTQIEHQDSYTNSDLDMKLVSDEVMAEQVNLNEETEKYKVLADNSQIKISEGIIADSDTPIEELSDAVVTDVASAPLSYKEKREARRNQRKFYKNLIKTQQDPELKPVTGFAISALVLGILSLFILPFVCGPLAIIFGGIALKRADSNPNKEGRGLAMAGLITGIIGTAGGLVLLLLAI